MTNPTNDPTTTFDELLDKYAEVIIKVAVNLQAGQPLWIGAMWGMATGVSVELARLVRKLTKHAYLAGASYVNVAWDDAHINRMRLLYGGQEAIEAFPAWRMNGYVEHINSGGAVLGISTTETSLLADIDEKRVAMAAKAANQHMLPLFDIRKDIRNASVINGVSPAWAQKVFPDLSTEAAIAQLWDHIFEVCRIKASDPITAWESHMQGLVARATALHAKRYDMLHFRAPGTDLRVGLVEQHVWRTALTYKDELGSIRNFPTEEVFTMPHRDRVDGVVSTTKPFDVSSLGLIENMILKFDGGRVVNATAVRGQSILDNLLKMDEGVGRLGEIALVPHSSPISKANTIFYSMLYDENASCHMALGRAIPSSIKNGNELSSDDLIALGANQSSRHEDFMMGSANLDVDGVLADGTVEAVMRGGEWAFDI